MVEPLHANDLLTLPRLSFDNEPPHSALCDTCRHDGISKAFCATCKGANHYMDSSQDIRIGSRGDDMQSPSCPDELEVMG